MSLLVLSANDVDALVSEFQPEELQLMMAKLFCRFSSQNSPGFGEAGHRTSISMPPRLHLSMLNHTALFMPARIGHSPALSPALAGVPGDTSVKVVCVPNQSDSRGLPATTMVLDESTGSVKAIVNARRLTALRNAAGNISYWIAGHKNVELILNFYRLPPLYEFVCSFSSRVSPILWSWTTNRNAS